MTRVAGIAIGILAILFRFYYSYNSRRRSMSAFAATCPDAPSAAPAAAPAADLPAVPAGAPVPASEPVGERMANLRAAKMRKRNRCAVTQEQFKPRDAEPKWSRVPRTPGGKVSQSELLSIGVSTVAQATTRLRSAVHTTKNLHVIEPQEAVYAPIHSAVPNDGDLVVVPCIISFMGLMERALVVNGAGATKLGCMVITVTPSELRTLSEAEAASLPPGFGLRMLPATAAARVVKPLAWYDGRWARELLRGMACSSEDATDPLSNIFGQPGTLQRDYQGGLRQAKCSNQNAFTDRWMRCPGSSRLQSAHARRQLAQCLLEPVNCGDVPQVLAEWQAWKEKLPPTPQADPFLGMLSKPCTSHSALALSATLSDAAAQSFWCQHSRTSCGTVLVSIGCAYAEAEIELARCILRTS